MTRTGSEPTWLSTKVQITIYNSGPTAPGLTIDFARNCNTSKNLEGKRKHHTQCELASNAKRGPIRSSSTGPTAKACRKPRPMSLDRTYISSEFG